AVVVERLVGTAALCGHCLIAGDREHPGGNLGASLEAASLLPDIEKHLTCEILGRGRVVHEPQHETVDPQVMACVQGLHREPVAGGAGFYEPFIGYVAVGPGVMCGTLRERRTVSHITSPPVFRTDRTLRRRQ